jgi:hypothetical protein
MPSTCAKPNLLFIFLCLLTVAVYYPGLSGDYMFDDMQNLLLNNRLELDSLDLTSLQAASFSSGSGTLRRPVSMASFALNRYFFGIAPYSHKVINLAIHVLTGISLLLLGRLILKSYREYRNPGLSPAAITWLPVIVSGLWLVHPLNLTSVLYIVQRMTSLAALFTVLGLCCYTLGRHRQLKGRPGWAWIFTGLFVFGGLAVLSKENGALLPLYMLVLEITLFRFRDTGGRFDRKIAAFFLLFLLIPVFGFLFWLIQKPGPFLGGYVNRDFTLTERVLTETRVLLFYLKQILIPSVSELGLYHDDITISRSLLSPVTTLFAVISLMFILATALLLTRKAPLVSLGILWFFAGHTLESTILPLEIAHEHRNYLADYGILLAAGAALLHLSKALRMTYVQTLTPALFICLFAYTTWVRADQWSDNVTHAVFEATHHPESSRAIFSAGRIHARLAIKDHNESMEPAFRYLDRASRLDQSGILPEVVMIKLANILDRPINEEWYKRITDKLEQPIGATNINGLHILGECQWHECKTPRETMEKIYQTALNNYSLQGKPRLGHVYASYGTYQINALGRPDLGREYFIMAVEAAPQELQHWINLLKLLLKMQDYDVAEHWLAAFRTSGASGATEHDFERFRRGIDKGRIQSVAETGMTDSTTRKRN